MIYLNIPVAKTIPSSKCNGNTIPATRGTTDPAERMPALGPGPYLVIRNCFGPKHSKD